MRLHHPAEPRDQWNSPIKDYEQLTDAALRLIFDETKAYFEETVDESEELTQRGTRMLFLLLPAVAAVVAFCFAHKEDLKPLNGFRFMLVIAAAGAFINCVINLFVLISAKNIHYRGSKPEEIMRPEIFNLYSPSKIEKALFVSEIERYQIKIERMESWNAERIFQYKEVVYSFNTMGAIGIILFILSISRF